MCDAISFIILKEIGLEFKTQDDLESQLIPREFFIDANQYIKIQEKIDGLKKLFSSSALTCLHKNASSKQKFPLLNLVRQILGVYYYKMKPIRKSDGYTMNGIKKYKRFFLITKKKSVIKEKEQKQETQKQETQKQEEPLYLVE